MSFLNRALQHAGFVDRARADALASELKEAQKGLKRALADVTSLTAAVEEARAGSSAWKRRHEEAAERRRVEHEDESARWRERVEKAVLETTERLKAVHSREIEQCAARLTKAEQGLDRSRAREEQRAAELQEMKSRVAATHHELQLARDHLMLMETKLDVLEAAINLLDGRTRESVIKAATHGS